MTCKQWEPLVSRFHDGESPECEARRLEKHLESCDACRAELVSFRRLSEVLSTGIEPDPAFVTRFRARRDQEFGAGGSLLVWRRLAVRLLPLAAAALIGAGAAVWLSGEEEALIEVEARTLGGGVSVRSLEASEPYPVLAIALAPFPGGDPP